MYKHNIKILKIQHKKWEKYCTKLMKLFQSNYNFKKSRKLKVKKIKLRLTECNLSEKIKKINRTIILTRFCI